MPISHASLANAIRALAMDAVEQAKSGHPGMPMGMADVATVLWTQFLKYDPQHPDWPDRDRFVLSAGHGSMLLYALLYLTGYPDMTLDELRRFRQLGARTAGHPEFGHALRHRDHDRAAGPGSRQRGRHGAGRAPPGRTLRRELVDHHTYVIAGDGCLMEGISHEAASLAGHLRLGRLIVLFDDNGISIDGPTSLAVSDDQIMRFNAYGWHTAAVDGHDPAAIERAIAAARAETGRPSLIACRTVIGKGAPTKAGKASAHGAPLGAAEIEGARAALDWPHPPFEVPEEILASLARRRSSRRRRLHGMASPPRGCTGRAARGLRRCHRRRAAGRSRDDRQRLQAQAVRRAAGSGQPQGQPDGAGGADQGGAGDGRRLGRPHPLQPHQHSFHHTDHARRVWRALRQLRRARARHGGGHERDGCAWRHHPLWRHLPGVRRLLPPCAAAGGADAPAGDLRRHPQFDRARRGRPDPSAGRASGEPARDPEHAGVPPGGCGRDGRVLGAGPAAGRGPVGAGAHAPGAGDAPHRAFGRESVRARRLPPGRRRRAARRDHPRHRLGGASGAGGPRAARRRGDRGGGGVDAELGAVRPAGSGLSLGRARQRAAGRGRGGGSLRLDALHRQRGRLRRHERISGPAGPPSSCTSISASRPSTWRRRRARSWTGWDSQGSSPS